MNTHVAQKRKKVLVVDDDSRVLKFIEVSLRLRRFQVLQAMSGEEAIEMVQKQDPDIMLLDIMMPRVDGLEVLRQLRDFTEIPVIAFSADFLNRQKAMENGADDFIGKPFNFEELIEKINALTNGVE